MRIAVKGGDTPTLACGALRGVVNAKTLCAIGLMISQLFHSSIVLPGGTSDAYEKGEDSSVPVPQP
jgi:hypothetical protein